MYNEWSKTKTKQNSDGDPQLYMKYRDYRRALKHTINAAKKKYYGTKITKNVGDLKKHGL